MSYSLSLSAKEIDETLVGAKHLLDQKPATESYVNEAIHEIELTPGPAGPAGYSPVKGQDYFTDDDKTEMVNAVLAALPAAEGVLF